MFLARHFASISQDFNLTAASNTGGKAIVNTNDFAPGIDGIFRENGSYYLLGYATSSRSPGSLHRLNVSVKQPGMTVRARSGFEVPAVAKTDAKNPPPPPVAGTVAGPVATGDLTMQVAVAPIAAPGGPIVAMVLSLSQPGVDARTRHTFSLQTSAFTPDGQPRASQRHMATVTLVPAGPNRTAEYELLSQMALPPGRYELRLGAVRDEDQVAGSVYADVEIPDFARAPLSLSGVLISAMPSAPAAPKDAFATVVPVVPTSRRAFDTADLVTGFLRVYQGGEAPLVPASVAVRIVDGRDQRAGAGCRRDPRRSLRRDDARGRLQVPDPGRVAGVRPVSAVVRSEGRRRVGHATREIQRSLTSDKTLPRATSTCRP